MNCYAPKDRGRYAGHDFAHRFRKLGTCCRLQFVAIMNDKPSNSEVSQLPATSPHRGPMILVFGLLSLVACVPLGIAAWVLDKRDLSAIRAGRMDRSGEGMTKAGYVIGIVGTLLFALGAIAEIVLAVIGGVFYKDFLEEAKADVAKFQIQALT
jgi:hypothetical protein